MGAEEFEKAVIAQAPALFLRTEPQDSRGNSKRKRVLNYNESLYFSRYRLDYDKQKLEKLSHTTFRQIASFEAQQDQRHLDIRKFQA